MSRPPTQAETFGCGLGKKVHLDHKSAARKLSELRRANQGRGVRKRLCVYYCNACRGYHVGSKPNRRPS